MRASEVTLIKREHPAGGDERLRMSLCAILKSLWYYLHLPLHHLIKEQPPHSQVIVLLKGLNCEIGIFLTVPICIEQNGAALRGYIDATAHGRVTVNP